MAQIKYVSAASGEILAREVTKAIAKYESSMVSVQVLTSKVPDPRRDELASLYEAFIVLPG